MLMKNIQHDLLAAFESSNLTYDELAKRTNLPKSALYRYLNGDTEKIPIDRFQAICAELHADAGAILGWKNDKIHMDLQLFADPDYPLSAPEQQLVADYRALSPRGQQLLMDRAEELKLLYGKKSEGISTLPLQKP